MNLESYTAEKLKEVLDNNTFRHGRVLPLTERRGRSQLLNPDLGDEDVLLILARDESGGVTGLAGALPSRAPDGSRCAWNSGWWADPERGRDSAMHLFLAFLRQWDMKAMFSDMTPVTCRILGQLSFIQTRKVPGIRIYLKSPLSKTLTGKNRLFRKLYGMFRLADHLVDLLAAPVLLPRKIALNRKPAGIWTETETIDADTERLILNDRRANVSLRGKKHFEWIREHPWLSTSAEPGAEKYPFTSSARQFEQYWYRHRTGGRASGFLWVTVRDGHLRVPYFFYEGSIDMHILVRLLWQRAVQSRCWAISSTHPRIREALAAAGLPRLFRKKFWRFTGMTDPLAELMPEGAFFQDGDGDAVFT